MTLKLLRHTHAQQVRAGFILAVIGGGAVEAVEKPKMPKSPHYESMSYEAIFCENRVFYSLVRVAAIGAEG